MDTRGGEPHGLTEHQGVYPIPPVIVQEASDPGGTNLWCTEGDTTTCTPKWGLCSRGSVRRSSLSAGTTGLVAKTSFQVLRRSW